MAHVARFELATNGFYSPRCSDRAELNVHGDRSCFAPTSGTEPETFPDRKRQGTLSLSYMGMVPGDPFRESPGMVGRDGLEPPTGRLTTLLLFLLS